MEREDGLGCARGLVSAALFYLLLAGLIVLVLWGRPAVQQAMGMFN